MRRQVYRQLPHALDHDSVWSFITGADQRQLRLVEQRTGYELKLAAVVGAHGESVQGALYLPLSIQCDEELGAEHERIAKAVYEIVGGRWEVETLSFHAGTIVPTYQRVEWIE